MNPSKNHVNVQVSHWLPIQTQSMPSAANKMKTLRLVTYGPSIPELSSGARSNFKLTNLCPLPAPATQQSFGALRCTSSEVFLN